MRKIGNARLLIVVALLAFVLAGGAMVARAALPQQSESVDLLSQANVEIDGAAAGDLAGYSVAGAADVNGDGIADVILGGRAAGNNGRAASGSAYVIFGQASPTRVDLAELGSSGFRIDGAAPGDAAGVSVAGAGDVNGDGRADVIVGAEDAGNNSRAFSGSAYVVFGKASTTAVDLDTLGLQGFRIDGAAAGDEAGESVAGAGDLNGDGRADVIVGAFAADNNARASSGSAYVVFGRASTATVDLGALGGQGFRIDGATAGDEAGSSVAGAGDVNGDGRADVIVGASQAGNNSRAFSGSAYVVFGKASTTTVDLGSLGAEGFRIDGATAGDLAGSSVSGAGDINRDGIGDVIVGAVGASNNARTSSGSAYVIFGNVSTDPVDLGALGGRGFRIDGAAAGDQAGYSVAGAGDINGDGRPDLILGAFFASNNSRAFSGSAYLIFGKASTTPVDLGALGARGFRIDGGAAFDFAGGSVAGAGDVNGDGRPDVILGAQVADNNGRTSSGSAYVLYGFGTPSLSYPRSIAATVGQAFSPLVPTVNRTGTASFAISPPLPAGLSLDPTTGVVSGTPTQAQPPTAHTVTMTDLAGTASAPLQVTVNPAPSAPVLSVPPSRLVLTALRVSPRRFALPGRLLNGRCVKPTSKNRTQRRCTRAVKLKISYRLNSAARAKITITHQLPGRLVNRRCVNPTRTNRHQRACTRLLAVRALTVPSDQGANSLTLNRSTGLHKLGPGQYQLTAIPIANGQQGPPQTTTFRITR